MDERTVTSYDNLQSAMSGLQEVVQQMAQGQGPKLSRAERRQQMLAAKRAAKHRNKQLNKLTPEQRVAVQTIEKLVPKCTTYGQMFFLKLLDSMIMYLDNEAKEKAMERVRVLERESLDICHNDEFKEFFNTYITQVEQKRRELTNHKKGAEQNESGK